MLNSLAFPLSFIIHLQMKWYIAYLFFSGLLKIYFNYTVWGQLAHGHQSDMQENRLLFRGNKSHGVACLDFLFFFNLICQRWQRNYSCSGNNQIMRKGLRLLNTAPLLPSVALVVMASKFLASCLLQECHLLALETIISESRGGLFHF